MEAQLAGLIFSQESYSKYSTRAFRQFCSLFFRSFVRSFVCFLFFCFQFLNSTSLYIHYRKSWRVRIYPHLRVQIYSIASFFQILMNAWIQRCLVARVASVFVKTHRVATCVNVNRVCYILTTLAKVSSLFQIHDKTQGQRLKGLWHCYLVHRAS